MRDSIIVAIALSTALSGVILLGLMLLGYIP